MAEVFIIKNVSTNKIELNDFGFIIPASESVELGDHDHAILSTQLYALLENGNFKRIINGVEVDFEDAYASEEKGKISNYVQDLTVTSTKEGKWPDSFSTEQTKLLLSTSEIPAGTYKITISYAVNKDEITNILSRIIVDKDMLGDIQNFVSIDAKSWYYITRIMFIELESGKHDIALQFASETSGEVNMKDASLELTRVS